MKFYHFGEKDKPVILLLPGTCCHWKLNFGEVIPLLEKDFHVVCVSYDGFDETEDTVFDNMISQTEKIENYITESGLRLLFGWFFYWIIGTEKKYTY